MSRIHTISEQLIDYGERLSKMADAAEGRHQHAGRKVSRWILLPAAGAGLYAFARSDFFSRQAKEVVDEARSRAADLPDDLMTRVQEATNASTSNRSQASRSSANKRTSTRKRAGSGANRSGAKVKSSTR
jgi:hypothetical protein